PSIPELERLPMRQVPRSDSAWKSLQFDAYGLGVMDTRRKDVNMGIAPNYSGVYLFERSSTYNFPRWKVEGPSTSIPSRNNLFPTLGHSGRLTATSPVLSSTPSVNLPISTICIGAKQIPFDWSTSEAMANSIPVNLDQTSFEAMTVDLDLDDPIGFDQSQRSHGCPTKREVDHPSSTLLNLPRVWTLDPSSRVTETETSNRVAKSGNRHICGICSKTHTRPSRAVACENDHLGYQPFICDGTCGDSAW
ncbi:hypothetical protein FRC20_000481, partial [Serendipita sp. 405]